MEYPEKGRLVRPKYRETSSHFYLCYFVINVYIFGSVALFLIACDQAP